MAFALSCRTNQSYSTYPGLNLSARLGSSDYKKLICADVCVYSLVALWATFLLTGQTNIALAIAFLCIYFKLQTRLARAKLFALQIVYTFNTADRHTFVQRFDFFSRWLFEVNVQRTCKEVLPVLKPPSGRC